MSESDSDCSVYGAGVSIQEKYENHGPSVDMDGWTELHRGAINNNVTQIEAFLRAWPSLVDQRDTDGCTALHFAAEWLCENKHHRTIFSFAEEFSKKIKEYILSSTKAIKENPALCKLMQYLAKNGCGENLFSIFADLDTNIKEKLIKQLKLLHAAVESGDTRTVSLVYQYDNNIKRRNDLGHTLIWVAIEGNHTAVLDYLLSKGASYTDTDKLNKTPLHRAAFLGRVDIVKFLLQKDVDPNIRNKFHRTPLHYAAMEGYNEVIIELLSHKNTDINSRNHYRRSPIFETVRCFQLNSLKLFIEYGSKVITKDILDMYPYRLAKRQKYKNQILEVFKDYGYTDETVVENKWTLCKIRVV